MPTRTAFIRTYPRLTRYLERTAIALIGLTGAVAGASLLSSCALSPLEENAIPRGFHFDYTLVGGDAVGLVQAFDDGSRIYLQFKTYPTVALTVRSETGDALPTERSGAYAVIAGLHSHLSVHVGASDVEIHREGAPGAAGEHVSAAIRDAQAQRMRLEAQERELRAKVTELELELAAARAQLARVASRLVIHFANNSARVRLDTDVAAAMAEAVADRPAITITGYTDANYADAKGARLALERAEAVRAVLIEHGVSVDKIHVAEFAARHFAADNATQAGKALNRRAEIVSSSKSEAIG